MVEHFLVKKGEYGHGIVLVGCLLLDRKKHQERVLYGNGERDVRCFEGMYLRREICRRKAELHGVYIE